MEEVTPEQLEEYETQLADVEQLLEATPDDEQLLSLKADVEQLILLAKESLGSAEGGVVVEETVHQESIPATDNTTTAITNDDSPYNNANVVSRDIVETESAALDGGATTTMAMTMTVPPVAAMTSNNNKSDNALPHKKSKKSSKTKIPKNFEVPSHLVINEADTEAEKNRKRRATKALKNKWREKKKEAESSKKQKSWQSFQKKKSTSKNKTSIFATQDGDTKVGVSSGRSMTEFNERTRHKY